MDSTHAFRRKSDFDPIPEFKDSQGFRTEHLGQPCPQHCLRELSLKEVSSIEPLGEPLAIGQVAKLIGCSAWTVRQRYVPAGLPHIRSSSRGKLLFYKNQVIRWLLLQQQKGGTLT